MDLIEDLKMLHLSFSFAMIYIIHKMLVLLKNHLNYLKDKILECFFIKYNRLLFFLKKLFVFIIYNDEKSKSWRRKHNQKQVNSF